MPLDESKAIRNESEKASTLTAPAKYEFFRPGMNQLQPWESNTMIIDPSTSTGSGIYFENREVPKSDTTVTDILDPSTTTGSGIYFEDREVPMPSIYGKKRSHSKPLVDGKALHPPPSLYQDTRLAKKRCTSPLAFAMSCSKVHHQDHISIHESLGFREVALAPTSLSSPHDQKATPLIMPQAPRLPNSSAVPSKPCKQDL